MSRQMIGKPVPPETAAKILEAFRQHPGIYRRAGAAAGVDARTAKKAWEKGLRTCSEEKYRTPFRVILALEQSEARARMEEEKRRALELAAEAEARRRGESREKAIKDVTDERVQEAQMVRQARAGTLVLLNSVTQVAAGLNQLSKKVKAQLEKYANEPADMSMMDVQRCLLLLSRLTTSLRQSNDAGQKAMEMSRLLLGEPTKIIGHQHLEGMSVQEAKAHIEGSLRAMEYLEAAGISELDGGVVGDPDLH